MLSIVLGILQDISSYVYGKILQEVYQVDK